MEESGAGMTPEQLQRTATEDQSTILPISVVDEVLLFDSNHRGITWAEANPVIIKLRSESLEGIKKYESLIKLAGSRDGNVD